MHTHMRVRVRKQNTPIYVTHTRARARVLTHMYVYIIQLLGALYRNERNKGFLLTKSSLSFIVSKTRGPEDS